MNEKIPDNEKLITIDSEMVCPHCEKIINSILEIHNKKIPSGMWVKSLRTIVYACPKCRVIFSATKLYY